MQTYFRLFPKESNINFELLGAAFQNFAYAACSYSRPKWKIKLKKMGENSYLLKYFLLV